MKDQEETRILDCPRLILYGNSLLSFNCENVEPEEKISHFLSEMIATMYSFGAIGLAAPQIGILKNMIVWNYKWVLEEKKEEDKYEDLFIMINPEIVESSDEDVKMYEECLSVPDIKCEVYRPQKIKVSYEDENRRKHTKKFKGIEARLIQHEIDHLRGVLFIDRASLIEREKMGPKLKLIKKTISKYNN
ncbi:MAG: peptide deformylase [Bacillota bacterium]